MLNLKPTVIGVTTIDLTSDEVIIKYPLERGNIIASHRDDRDTTEVIPDNATSLQDESLMSAAPSLPSSTAPPVVGSVSDQPHPSLKINKQPFFPESIKQVQNLISKENTAATLALIGVDKVISHIDAVTAQELDAKMEEDSFDGESNDGPSDWELEEDEKVSLLSAVAADQTVDDEVTQASKSDRSTEDNFDEAPDDEDFIPGNDNKKKEGKKCDNRLNSGSRDGPICLDPTVLAV